MARRASAVRQQIHDSIRTLPGDVDPVMAADVALELMVDSAWAFSRECKRLPPAVIRELLGRTPTDATHVYLTLAVDPEEPDGRLAKSWTRAIQGLADLETLNRWRSPQKREKFQALAADRHLLPAIQAAAARGENVSNNMLAVLVADGSDESMDALIHHFEDSADRLDALRMLQVHARDTPRLRALFSELDRDAAKTGSGALAIARLIGLPDTKFWFAAKIWSVTGGATHVPAVQLDVAIDSRKASWFEVSVARIARGAIDGHSSFTQDVLHDDPLGLGRCEAAELPVWLAKTAKKLRVQWDTPHVSSSVRGAKRAQIARWLVPG